MTADDTDVSPPGDETVASMSHGAGGDETEVVPPVTEAAPELAWSGCEDEADLVEPAAGGSWRRACGYAALIGLLPVGLLILIFGFPWSWFSPRPAAPSVATPTPPVAAFSAPELPPAAAPPPSVRTLGPVAVPPPSTVTITPAAPPPATVTVEALPPTDSSWTPEQLATSTCDVLWSGGTQADAVEFVRSKTGWDYGPASRWTAKATQITCPAAGKG